MRLIDDMESEAERLFRLAAGYRMAGEKNFATLHRNAGQAVRHAALLLKDLPK